MSRRGRRRSWAAAGSGAIPIRSENRYEYPQVEWPRRILGLLVVAVMAAGCGLLTPTPARFRPPLPDGEPLPGPRVDGLLASLEAEGLDCRFDEATDLVDREGNPHRSWNCRSGDQDLRDWMDVSFSVSEEQGPIESVGSHIFRDDGSDAGELDAHATAVFDALVVSPVVPEEFRPTPEELLDGVRRNYPMELGGGWFLGFDRSSISRTIRVVYSSAGGIEDG